MAVPFPSAAPAAWPDEARIQDCLSRAVAHEADLPAAEPVDPDATFQELGLDSLGAVEVAKQVERELGIELPPVLLFDFPTIGALARQLAAGPVVEPPA